MIDISSRHKNFDVEIMYKAIENNGAERKLLMKWHNEVENEINKGVNYCIMNNVVIIAHTPNHEIEDILVRDLAKIYPGYDIYLMSKRGTFGGKPEKREFNKEIHAMEKKAIEIS